jgi:hypothetical protein
MKRELPRARGWRLVLRSLLRFVLGKQDAPFAMREEGRRLVRSGDADGVRVVAEGAVVKSGEIANAALEARADGQGPENPLLAKLEFPVAGFRLEALDIAIGGARKEEKLVEVPLAGEFRLAQGEAGVLDEFARRERPQRDDGHASLFGERFERFGGSGKRLRDRNARETAESCRSCRAGARGGRLRRKVEIPLRHADDAAVFGDKGMCVPQPAARIVELQPRSAGEPDCRDAGMVEGRGELVEAGNALAARGDEGIDCDVQDAGCLAQTGLPEAELHCSGSGERQEEGGELSIGPPPRFNSAAPVCATPIGTARQILKAA